VATVTPLKIAYVMYNGLMRPSGEQSLNFHRLRALEWAGARTWVVSQEALGDLTEGAMAAARAEISSFAPSAELLFHRRRAAWPKAMAGELTRLCGDEGIDLLIFTQVQNYMAVRRVRAATFVPTLWDCRAGADARVLARAHAWQRLKNALFRWGYGPAAALSDHMVVVSERHAQHMCGRFGYPRSRMTVVPNGTDTEVFRPSEDVCAASRRRLAIGPGQLVVVYCGRVQPWQCLPESVSLFRHVHSLRPDAHLLVVTPDVEDAGSLAEDLAAQGACTIISAPHREVPQYLAAADVGLLLRRPTPRNAVASPTKFAEYLACGLPVAIGPGVGDYTELVNQRQLGVVVDPDEPGGWRPAARRLVDLVSGDRTTRSRCRETAVGLLSTEVQRLLFMEAVRGTARPAEREETVRDGA
jgi:glycosyltransferase involved in cell wall biosynthesis